jgi:hypothetical protein
MNHRIVILGMLPLIALAKPSAVGDVLTTKGKLKAELTTTYINAQGAKGITAPVQYQTMHGDIVVIPTTVGSVLTNRDLVNTSLLLRYGATQKLELYTAASGYASMTRTLTGSTYKNTKAYGLSNLSMGATWKIKGETDTPALLVGASANVLERIKIEDTTQSNYLKSFRVFATSYYTIDPLVFALKASYTHSRTKRAGKHTLKQGDLFSLIPSIYFSINPSTSLKWGTHYTYRGATNTDSNQTGLQGSSVAYFMGAGHEFENGLLMDVQAEYQPGSSSSSVSTTFSYTF